MIRRVFAAAFIVAFFAGPAAAAIPSCESPAVLVFFEWNSSDITDQARADISQGVGQAISGGSCPVAQVTVEGHADRSGDPAYNFRLSERRAIAVRDELARLGIADHLILYTAFGEHNSMVSTPDGDREPRNRRVVILISPR